MPVNAPRLPPEVAPIASHRARLARQLDLMIEDRAPVEQVRRLIADLDRISLDLAKTLGQGGNSKSTTP